MQPHEIILEMASDRSKLHKLAVLERHIDNEELVEGLRLCFDPTIKFWINKMPERIDSGKRLNNSRFTFASLAWELSNRVVTGNAAVEMVAEFASMVTQEEWELWYAPILKRDMRAGFSVSTFNKVLKKMNMQLVYLFACQLAAPFNEKFLFGEKLIDVKLDGVRFLAEVTEDSVTMYTRSGKINTNFPAVEEQLSEWANSPTGKTCRELHGGAVIIDGEMISKNFQKLMTQVNRQSFVDTSDAQFCVFDIVSRGYFFKLNAGCALAYTRNHTLQDTGLDGYDNILILKKELIDFDTPECHSRFWEINEEAIANDYEGIMIKDPLAIYELKRSRGWIKMKPVHSYTLKVMDICLGDAGKKYAKIMGDMHCEGIDEGKHIKVKVGGGFSDQQRQEFWDNREELIGHLVEIKADGITQAQDSETYALRFPRFDCFRDIEIGEKQ